MVSLTNAMETLQKRGTLKSLEIGVAVDGSTAANKACALAGAPLLASGGVAHACVGAR